MQGSQKKIRKNSKTTFNNYKTSTRALKKFKNLGNNLEKILRPQKEL